MTIVASNSLTLSNVNDGTITHTAYSWSADGKDGFTTVYPNLNLLDGTKDFSGWWGNSSEWTDDGTYKGLTVKKRTWQWAGMFKPITMQKDGVYTFSVYVKGSGNNANINRFVDCWDINGKLKWLNLNEFMGNDFNWKRDSFTVNLKTGDTLHLRYEMAGSGVVWIAGYKWEEGSIATPHMPSASEVTDNDYPSYRGEYSDFSSTASIDPSKYSWSLIRGNTSYTHTAYSWSAEGKDGFSTVYPNLNLLKNTRVPISLTGKNEINQRNFLYWFDNGKNIQNQDLSVGDTLTCKFDWTVTNPTSGSFSVQLNDFNWQALSKTISITSENKSGHSEFSFVVDSSFLSGIANGVQLRGDNVPTNSVLTISNFLFTKGSTATPHMPSESEVTTADYPSYIGQYTDSNIESSLDYSKYQWAIFKGQDSNAYTAYSWSSDGADRFSTVYPNLNLLEGTKDSKPWGTGGNKYNQDVEIIYFNNHKTVADLFKTGDIITFSYDIEFFNTELYNSSNDSCIRIQILGGGWRELSRIYAKNLNGKFYTKNEQISSEYVENPTHKVNVSTTIELDKYFIESNGNANAIRLVYDYIPNGADTKLTNSKLEPGSTATPHMPSQSESQEQWQDAIPMYVGVGDKDSQNPSDYRWQLNPRYVQASSDSGLSNKAGLDDLASVADTANDALVQAQNAVSNEDYTSWLEHDYQTTINNLQDVSTQNKEDINNVNDRTTIVEGFYDRMKVKWNFINESFTFSEEGMFISNEQSKMAIQVTSDKIVFWDNNVDVAFITGEVLNIQKGVFLESATIGNHLITKFSNESPVTIIRYVGGIT